MLMPLHNSQVTGNWRTSPYARYTSLYLPFDRMGFGLDSTPAAMPLPGGHAGAVGVLRRRRTRSTPRSGCRSSRCSASARCSPTWAGRRRSPRRHCALLGLPGAPAAVLFAAGTAAAALAGAPPVRALQQLDPLLPGGVSGRGAAAGARHGPAGAAAGRQRASNRADAARRVDLLLVADGGLPCSCVLPFRVRAARSEHLRNAAAQLYFQQLLQELPGARRSCSCAMDRAMSATTA